MSVDNLDISSKGVSVHTGFPNAALDSAARVLDLNRLLIQHPAATYYMQIAGCSWQANGIFDGDIAIVDRVLTPHPNDLVVWWQGESFVISAFHLVPRQQEVWGVIAAIVHRYRGVTHAK